MHPHVHLIRPMRLLLLTHKVLMLVVEEVDDRRPATITSKVSMKAKS